MYGTVPVPRRAVCGWKAARRAIARHDASALQLVVKKMRRRDIKACRSALFMYKEELWGSGDIDLAQISLLGLALLEGSVECASVLFDVLPERS